LKNSLYQVIPYKYLQILEPHELEMLICGKQTIDVKDWKKYTNYKGYTKDDKVIKWFW
jgi:E3 ubiquitin-protein ligase NEDD4